MWLRCVFVVVMVDLLGSGLENLPSCVYELVPVLHEFLVWIKIVSCWYCGEMNLCGLLVNRSKEHFTLSQDVDALC
jgi:hypothetical protein